MVYGVGIAGVQAEGKDAVTYDLAGRRVAQPAGHGVYVQKGRKLMN